MQILELVFEDVEDFRGYFVRVSIPQLCFDEVLAGLRVFDADTSVLAKAEEELLELLIVQERFLYHSEFAFGAIPHLVEDLLLHLIDSELSIRVVYVVHGLSL